MTERSGVLRSGHPSRLPGIWQREGFRSSRYGGLQNPFVNFSYCCLATHLHRKRINQRIVNDMGRLKNSNPPGTSFRNTFFSLFSTIRFTQQLNRVHRTQSGSIELPKTRQPIPAAFERRTVLHKKNIELIDRVVSEEMYRNGCFTPTVDCPSLCRITTPTRSAEPYLPLSFHIMWKEESASVQSLSDFIPPGCQCSRGFLAFYV